jgi:hypothetical protein
MSESPIQTWQGLRMLESCAACVLWLAIQGHPNHYNAFEGIIMALYSDAAMPSTLLLSGV